MSRRTMPPTPARGPGMQPHYRDRILDERRHDPYEPPGKYAEPTACGDCGAVYQRGRWRWGAAPERAHRARCPACRRIRDRMPAGSLTVEGAGVLAHRAEMLQLVRHEAQHERDEHPLHRIIDTVERDGRIEITTTDIHLPQRLGKALARAHHGELSIDYGEDEYSVRVRWRG